MLLRTRLKGGILLYALLMAAVFSLFLQFYLNRMVASQRQSHALLSSSKAGFMAEQSRHLVHGNEGQITYNHGTVHYERQSKYLLIEVSLEGGKTYTYQYAVDDISTESQDKEGKSSETQKEPDTKAQSRDQ